eukprot:3576773-Rhodomonas_salina.2
MERLEEEKEGGPEARGGRRRCVAARRFRRRPVGQRENREHTARRARECGEARARSVGRRYGA